VRPAEVPLGSSGTISVYSGKNWVGRGKSDSALRVDLSQHHPRYYERSKNKLPV